MSLAEISALLYLLVYYGLILGLRSWMLYRQTGIASWRSGLKERWERALIYLESIYVLLLPFIVLNFVFLPENYQHLGPFTALVIPEVLYTGICLATIGLLFAFIAQLQMGDSWRFGLHQDNQTTLVTSGLFRLSRNPVYLGILIANIGFFGIVPCIASTTMVILLIIVLYLKIRSEESFLEGQHGEDYASYRTVVRRWL